MALVRRLLRSGWNVAGTCRSGDKVQALREMGIEVHLFDRDHPLDPVVLAGTTHILVSVPPDAQGDPVLALHGREIAALPGLSWFGYLSTTGVYGDHDGGWVDETTPVTPSLERSERRAEAEQGWLGLWRDHGLPVHVFRLAGIYGPGRSAIESLRAGKARRVVKPGQMFSRIHVDDIAQVLEASMDRPRGGAIYNVCDDDPAPPQDVITYAAQLLEMEPPPEVPFDQAGLSPMAASFYADNKRVRNDLIKTELGVRLIHPDYKSGLRAVLEAERDMPRRSPV